MLLGRSSVCVLQLLGLDLGVRFRLFALLEVLLAELAIEFDKEP